MIIFFLNILAYKLTLNRNQALSLVWSLEVTVLYWISSGHVAVVFIKAYPVLLASQCSFPYVLIVSKRSITTWVWSILYKSWIRSRNKKKGRKTNDRIQMYGWLSLLRIISLLVYSCQRKVHMTLSNVDSRQTLVQFLIQFFLSKSKILALISQTDASFDQLW